MRAFETTIPEHLKKLNYFPPNIKSYDDGSGIQVWLDNFRNIPMWRFDMDGIQWMILDEKHGAASQFLSHYKLAYGHVICTGLGFGTRENWLATKPEVTKITVLEKYIEIIDYHKHIGTEWSDKIEIINCDANEYKGTCDFLSIDHYELDDAQSIIDSVQKVNKNISCDSMWFWMLEAWVKLGYIVNNPANIVIEKNEISYGGVYFMGGDENILLENYMSIKKFLGLKKLPDLKLEELTKFINAY